MPVWLRLIRSCGFFLHSIKAQHVAYYENLNNSGYDLLEQNIQNKQVRQKIRAELQLTSGDMFECMQEKRR